MSNSFNCGDCDCCGSNPATGKPDRCCLLCCLYSAAEAVDTNCGTRCPRSTGQQSPVVSQQPQPMYTKNKNKSDLPIVQRQPTRPQSNDLNAVISIGGQERLIRNFNALDLKWIFIQDHLLFHFGNLLISFVILMTDELEFGFISK